jgi:hypothetical protein
LHGAIEAWERARAIFVDLDSPRSEEIGRELEALEAALDVEVLVPRRESSSPVKRGDRIR